MISYVHVPVTNVWTGPDAPRDLDTAVVADEPDTRAWTESLDTEARLDLHGRVVTQLVRGEPVDIVSEHDDGWSEIVARWQPSSQAEDGYPGWVRRAHLSAHPVEGVDVPRSPEEVSRRPTGEQLLETARRFVGIDYLWGGTCDYAVDCSGFVHRVLRAHGIMVPRDAHDQQAACSVVPLGEEQPGDLYFFARDERPVHHVGLVVTPGVMLHAPESGRAVVEEPLTPEREKTQVAAGRF